MPQMLRTLTALLLALSLVATGQLAASARGQMVAGGQLLALCSSGGVVQATLDAEGRPTGERHLCPDLAPGLLAALGLHAPDVVAPLTVLAAELPRQVPASLSDRFSAAPQARAPPVPA
jgi:hypothetical protein